jgi:hypothetical protein
VVALVCCGKLALLLAFDLEPAGPVLECLDGEPPGAGQVAEGPGGQHDGDDSHQADDDLWQARGCEISGDHPAQHEQDAADQGQGKPAQAGPARGIGRQCIDRREH